MNDLDLTYVANGERLDGVSKARGIAHAMDVCGAAGALVVIGVAAVFIVAEVLAAIEIAF